MRDLRRFEPTFRHSPGYPRVRRTIRANRCSANRDRQSRCRLGDQRANSHVHLRRTLMSKKLRAMKSKDRRPRCPACNNRIGSNGDRWAVAARMGSLLQSRPGELTECDHCFTLLEYQGDLTSLTLRVAPAKRADAFKRSKEAYRQPRLSELVDHVRKYRQMPRESSDVFRMQQSQASGNGQDN